MNVSEFSRASSRPYSSLLQHLNVLGTGFSSKQLAFNMQPQTQSNWCWAATSTSVSGFYWALATWTQCLVANAELAFNDCCKSPVPTACNVPWYLDRALTRTNNFVSITGPVSFQTVRTEIDAGRPLGARVGWSGGGGHFMVIYGYGSAGGVDYLDIDDPIYGKSHLPTTDFATRYQGSGTWTHTYFTKRFINVPIKLLPISESILDRISKERALLNLKGPFASPAGGGISEPDDVQVGIAQRVYSVGLDSLLEGGTPSLEAANLRVFETSGDSLRAFYDVEETNQGRVLQMSTSDIYLKSFAHGLSAALAKSEDDPSQTELKILRIPALNFEGLWLSHEDADKDSLVPLFSFGPLPQYEPVPMSEALDRLRAAARPLAEMDDTMGA